ncbi:MAG: hypothetical protein ACOX52_23230 [Verrucomicrobiota bacterium]
MSDAQRARCQPEQGPIPIRNPDSGHDRTDRQPLPGGGRMKERVFSDWV